jgi:hypothetical protein
MWLVIVTLSATPLALVLWRLNRRDRRREAVWNAIGPEVAALDRHPALAGSVAVRVDMGLAGRARVTLDMSPFETPHVWPVIARFARAVPARTRVRVIRAASAERGWAAISMEALSAR